MVLKGVNIAYIWLVTFILPYTIDGLSFGSSTYTGSIEEELPVGSLVVLTPTLSVTAAAGPATYSITGTIEFTIEPSTGQLKTAVVLDYETTTSHGPFTISVNDGVSTATADVTVFVVDTNVNAPECDPMLYTVEVPENSPPGTNVLSMTCTDADGSAITYSITAGDDSSPKFTIPDPAVAAIETTATVLDFETKSTYELNIQLSDGENTNVVKLYVTVSPENEFSPVWDTWNPAYTSPTVPYFINEDVAIGTTVLSMAATDDDSSTTHDGMLTYSLVSSTPTSGLSFFQVDSASGDLVTINELDCDGPSASLTYDLQVKVSDVTGLSTTRDIKITINDINDNAPVFSKSHYVASITEGDPAGTSVKQVTATDQDATDNTVTYTIISGNTNNHFGINGDTVEVAIPVDLDAPSSGPVTFTLVIRATDSGTPPNTGQATVSVTVASNNEHSPVFGDTIPLGAISVPETASVGYSVATVTATDSDYGDDGVVAYSITGGDPDAKFQLDPVTGLLTLQSQMDFETLSVNPITLQITAIDGTNTAVMDLDVTITDSNDNAPSCDQTSYIATVNEDVATGTIVQQMTCNDADAGTTLTFTFLSGNTNNDLNVDSTGAITNLNALDYDAATPTLTYDLEVRVSDGTLHIDVPVTLSLVAVNEFTPTFTPTVHTLSTEENVAISSVVGIFSALDDDSYPHNIQEYTITSVTAVSGPGPVDPDSFIIDGRTGQVKVAKILDYETVAEYELIVVATDKGGLVGTGTATVSITDTNDNEPQCSPASNTASIEEASATVPETIVALSCSDADGTAAYSTLAYSLTQSPGSGDFEVDSTGSVSVLSSLDYESVEHYTLTVEVTDGTYTSTVYISVSVTPVNEGAPMFTPPYTQDLPEDAPIGTSVKRVTATDVDAPTHKHGKLFYSIESGNIGGKFQIDPTSGVVKTVSLLDREMRDTYDLTIQATEEAGTNSATATLHIFIIDIDDNPPTCVNNIISASVNEAVVVPYTITTLDCSDVDNSSTLTYSLKSGDPLIFSMNGPELQVIGTLDWDAGIHDYDVTVSISDGHQSLDISGKITVKPVNEFPPVFTNGGQYTVSVSEDQSVGSVLVTVTATDDDSSDNSHGQITYTIISGTSNKLQLVSSTGEIKLVSALDRETVPLYEVVVQGTDGLYTASATVSISVTDINDNAPVFGATSYSALVSEDEALGYLVLTVSAYDTDDNETDANGKVAYSIESGDVTDAFDINPATGEITTKAGLDYETQTSYSFIVVAKDKNGGMGALSGTSLVSIQVTGVNEHTPVFTDTVYSQLVSETASISSSVGKVLADDLDHGLDGDVYYVMDGHPKFYLDADTGVVYLQSLLDYESEHSYNLTISAVDRGSPALLSQCILSIEVIDVNDNSPECTPGTFVKNAREDIAPGGAVVTLSCVDADDGPAGTLVYTITSVNGIPGSGDFSIDTSGMVTFNGQLDYETDRSYDIEILVDDSIGSPEPATVIITLLITDVNEYAPSFQGQPSGTNKGEDTAIGTTVITLSATDKDIEDKVSYSFETPSQYFYIEQATGTIVVQSILDYETDPLIELVVIARDSGTVNGSLSSTHTFTVTIIDTNDFVPVFMPSSYIGYVSEASTMGTTLLTVTAIDKDAGAAGTVTYNIMSGNTGNVFRIDTNVATGEAFLVVDDNSFLDYETMQRYEMWIQAVDAGGFSGNASVVINVEPYNEHPPQFTPTNAFTFHVYENVTVGTQIMQVSASDEDHGDDGRVQYRLLTASEFFQVDFLSGNISVASALDRESSTVQVVEVLATDHGLDPGRKSSTGTLSVTVLDVNDHIPYCSPSVYMAEMPEDSPGGSSLVTLTCSDDDDDPDMLNNQITYSMHGLSGIGTFEVDAATGLVELSATPNLDAETEDAYEVLISVADKGLPSLSSTATIYVTITGINEDSPVFSADPYVATIAEGATINTVVTYVTASDPDIGIDGELYYMITSGNIGNKFQIDSQSGSILVSGPLDREMLDTYTLEVTATDFGTNPNPLSSSTTVEITVTDINDNPPMCTAAYHVELMEENSPEGTHVYTLDCSDADEGENATLKYAIDSGNTDMAFSIDKTSGVVTVKTSTALDVETEPRFILAVIVSDSGSPSLSTTVILQVDLIDQNEVPPQFLPFKVYSAFVDESSKLGDAVINITATDTDSGINGKVRYVITGGNTNNEFYINTVTGEVMVQNDLDRESIPEYDLTISAFDLGTPSLSSEGTLKITLNDYNDNVPTCKDGPYELSTPEDTKPGSSLLKVECSDKDLGVNAEIRYHITDGDPEGIFIIDPQTGKIRLASAMDYETTKWYQLLVEISDMGTPSLTGTTQIKIFVSPVNEHSPFIHEPTGGYTASIAEDTPLGDPFLHISGTDEDLSIHGLIRWSIVGGNEKGHFAIDENTGNITVVSQLDREDTSSFTIVVRAADSSLGSPDERYAETDVTVTITDVNDNIPVFIPGAYVVTAMEGAAVGSLLSTVTVHDDDEGVNAEYDISIISGDDDGIFSVSGNSVYLMGDLDHDKKQLYTLHLRVADRGDPSLSSTAYLIVNVLSENEFPPVFVDKNSTVTLKEDIPVGAKIYDANATDADIGKAGELRYDIVSGDPTGSTFLINPISGIVITVSALDYDLEPQEYQLVISATDNAGEKSGALKAHMTLTVVLEDVNDITPTFIQNTFIASASEDVAEGITIVAVNATDGDSGINSEVKYSIVSGDDAGYFTIDGLTGEISVAPGMVLDFEAQTAHTLLVKAQDKGKPVRSSSCIVSINVIDTNDNIPQFMPSNILVSIEENNARITLVTSVASMDADRGNNALINFYIDGASDPQQHFFINKVSANNAEIYTKAPLNRENIDRYELHVLAIDGGMPRQTGTGTVIVMVKDANDNVPEIQGLPYETSVYEDTPLGTTLFNITATDEDDGLFGMLHYSILSGDDGYFFMVPETGIIRTQKELDRETTRMYRIAVEAKEVGTPFRAVTATATLTVLDVNDNTPEFVLDAFTFYVQENVDNRTWVGRASATDADTGKNSALLYSIKQTIQGPPGHFYIDPASGDIYTATSRLDRETNDLYVLFVQTKDDGAPSLYTETKVYIVITDHNDNIPLCQNSIEVSIPENTIPGLVVANISVTDNDIGPNSALKYTVTDPIYGRAQYFFDVDQQKAQLVLTNPPDRERDLQYNFRVSVEDHGKPVLASSCEVKATITDLNDNAPVFSPGFYCVDIAHNAEAGTSVLQVSATDADEEGSNSIILYEMAEEQREFNIGYYTGNISKLLQDDLHPFKKYIFNVSAKDAGVPSLTTLSPAIVRIDTFQPDTVVILIGLTTPYREFGAYKQRKFLRKLEETLATRYPLVTVRMWKLASRESSLIRTTSLRRKLLQTESDTEDYAVAYVYAVANSETYEQRALDEGKSFVVNDELLSVWQLDRQTKDPTNTLTGTNFEDYGIVHVEPYVEARNVPWVETTGGILTLFFVSLIALLLLIGIILLCYYFCCKDPDDDDDDRPDKLKRGNPPIVVTPSSKSVPADRYYNNDQGMWDESLRTGNKFEHTPPPSYRNSPVYREDETGTSDDESRYSSTYATRSYNTFHH